MLKISYGRWDIKKLVSSLFLIFFQDLNACSWCCSNSINIDDPLDTMIEFHIRQKYSKINEKDSLKEIFLHNQEKFTELRIFDELSYVLDRNPNDFWRVWHICLEFSKKERTLLDEKIKIADLFFIMIEKMHRQKMAYAPLERFILKINNESKKSTYIPKEDLEKLNQYIQILISFKN